jgi:pyridoxal phosphate enzyme (YggS family)
VTEITEHLANIVERVARAAQTANRRADDVTIVAVSKQQTPETIAAAYAAGQRHFGENYVQEAIPKMDALADREITWHFIGRVQANKTRLIAERFQWVHTVDRLKIAERLSTQRPFHAPPLNVLIQVNQAAEPQKSGVPEDEVPALAAGIAALARLRLRGLMTMPPADGSPEENARYFRRLAELRARLEEQGLHLDTLSMGMSGDFEEAIAAGATCVRIGTAIFGRRPSPPAD